MADIYFACMFINAVKKTDPKKLIALLIMIILNNISQCQTSPLKGSVTFHLIFWKTWGSSSNPVHWQGHIPWLSMLHSLYPSQMRNNFLFDDLCFCMAHVIFMFVKNEKRNRSEKRKRFATTYVCN